MEGSQAKENALCRVSKKQRKACVRFTKKYVKADGRRLVNFYIHTQMSVLKYYFPVHVPLLQKSISYGARKNFKCKGDGVGWHDG